MDAILSVNAEVVEACIYNPGFQIASLRCTTQSKIYITNVSVGKSWVGCDSYYCIYQTLTVDHPYFMNISNSCDGRALCTVSASELYELSKTEPYIFPKCGNGSPLYNDRNKVTVQYVCSGKYATL